LRNKRKTLAEEAPELAKQWHPTKNGDLKPTDVTLHSHEKVVWYLPYDDPETGKHFDFEWEDYIYNRSRGRGCPYLVGRRVWPGYNDLATKAPELAKQWHPTKNGDLKPTDVTCGKNKKVFWYLPYDDPETGKHFDFEWDDYIYSRARGCGCPYVCGQRVWAGYNDLATKAPELAKQWHPTRNGNLTPADVTCGRDKKVWWYLPYDDPETGKHFDFEWEDYIYSRARGCGCPYLVGRRVWPGYNDLATKAPELAKEWHPTKNGDLKPTDVTLHSNEKVVWYLPYDDPETGKHFDFEWEEYIRVRAGGCGCPYLVGRRVWPGYNDLATKAPELAKQWHPTKNGDLKPTDVTCGKNKKVFWYLPYDDPETGKHFDFEWEEYINIRAGGCGCPYVCGQKVWAGYNDLATKAPELAKEWHPTKNGDLKPTDVTLHSNEKVVWYLPYDDPETGKHFDFEWEDYIYSRARGRGCPYLSGQRVWAGYNDLASSHPEVAEEWHPTKNRRRTPEQVYKKDTRKYWWLCGKCRHSWRASVRERTFEERMCPVCSKNKDIVG